jgi:hypothetical protein
MIDYRTPTKIKAYEFRWKDLHWIQLQLPASAILYYNLCVRLPAGDAEMNLPTAAIIGLTVLLVNIMVINLNSVTGPSTLPPWMRLNEGVFKKSGVAGLILIGSLSFFIHDQVWKWGACFLVVILFTLWFTTRLKSNSMKIVLKEPVTALLYATAVWGSAAIASEWETALIWTFGSVFLLTTFQSLLMTSHFNALKRLPAPNFAKWIGKEATRRLVHGVSILAVSLCVTLIYKSPFRYAQRTAIVFAALAITHSLILIKSKDPASRTLLAKISEFTCLFPLFLV